MPRNIKGEIIPILNRSGVTRQLVKDAFGTDFWETMVKGQCYYTPKSAIDSRSNLLSKQNTAAREIQYYRLVNKKKLRAAIPAENTTSQKVVNSEENVNKSSDEILNGDTAMKIVDNNNKEGSPKVKPAGQNGEADKSAKISDIRMDEDLVGKLAAVNIGEKDINC